MHADERTRGGTGAGTPHYRIRVRGCLGARWTAYFDGFRVTDAGDGTTVIHGPVADQAALHGVLHKLRDVGLPLVSLAQDLPCAGTPPSDPSASRAPEGS